MADAEADRDDTHEGSFEESEFEFEIWLEFSNSKVFRNLQIKTSTRGSGIIFEGAGSKLKNRYGSGELGASVKIFFRKVTNLIFPTFENPINFAISEEPMEEDSMMTNEEAEDADGVDDEQDNEESHGAGGEQNRTIRHLFERLCAIWRRQLH